MEISNLSYKELKVTVIKMLTELGKRRGTKCELQQRTRKYTKELVRAEEYND